MNRVSYSDISEPTMTDAEVGFVLRRQLIGSAVAAVVVIALAGLTAIHQAHGNSDSAGSSHFAIVQQPTFVAPAEHVVAWKQNNPAAPQAAHNVTADTSSGF